MSCIRLALLLSLMLAFRVGAVAVEFEVLDRLTVNGNGIFKSSVMVTGKDAATASLLSNRP